MSRRYTQRKHWPAAAEGDNEAASNHPTVLHEMRIWPSYLKEKDVGNNYYIGAVLMPIAKTRGDIIAVQWHYASKSKMSKIG